MHRGVCCLHNEVCGMRNEVVVFIVCMHSEVCCMHNEVSGTHNEVCCNHREVCCTHNEVCCMLNEVCCVPNEVCGLISGDSKIHPPCPVLLLLSTDGVLVPFHMAYFHPQAPPLTSPPQPLAAQGARTPTGQLSGRQNCLCV